ncbi:MAG: tetratricopeptide repeat protein [Weeksellaceae bacterium]
MQKSPIFKLFLSIFLISCTHSQIEKLITEEEILYEQGNYKEAIKKLDEVIKRDPKNAGAYINRGANKSALEDFESANSDYQKALELIPNNRLALFNIGNNFKKLGKSDLAVENYNKALKVKGGQQIFVEFVPNENTELFEFYVPTYQIAYERGMAYYDLGELGYAFQDFNYALENNFEAANCHYFLGLVYYSGEQKDKACDEFNLAKQLNDKDAEKAFQRYCTD